MSKAAAGESSAMGDLGTKQGENSSTPTENAQHPAFSIATSPSYLRSLFLSDDGLRPGWGFAFYGLSFFILQHLSVEWFESTGIGTRGSGLWASLIESLLNVLSAVVPSLVLARVERRPWGLFGLPARRAFGRFFWIGSVWGFSAITILMLSLYAAHCFSFGHFVLHGVRVLKFAAFWAVMFLSVGVFEEFLFRGYSLFTLSRGMTFWPAATVLSVLFGLAHLRNEGEGFAGALAAAWIGLFFCLTLRRTGTLWFAVGFHAAWDWGETFFYSVPDSGMVAPGHLLSSSLGGPQWLSGGSVGPEASVLCFAVVLLSWALLDRLYPARKSEVPL